MKTALWVIITLIVIIAGGVFWWQYTQSTAPKVQLSFTSTSTPVTAATTTANSPTSSSMQSSPTGPITHGNIIDPGSGAPPIVGDNLMLGIDQSQVLGTYLLGYTGMTLYMYEKDTTASSTCYGQCAQTWPPYIVSGSDTINTEYGVDASKVSIISRADGSLQVAYNGHPLYFYSGDTQETVNGQGQGGVWYVVKP